MILDATHGLQRYGLKLVSAHVVDEEFSGTVACTALFLVCLHDFGSCCMYTLPVLDTQLLSASMLPGTLKKLSDIKVLSLCNAHFLQVNAMDWHGQCNKFLNNAKLHMHLAADGCKYVLEITMYTGRPVVWALVRQETKEVYSTILGDLKSACDGILNLQQKDGLKPSCVLVDNSNAEISAVKCAPGSLWSLDEAFTNGKCCIDIKLATPDGTVHTSVTVK
jgi:hypothetical protein